MRVTVTTPLREDYRDYEPGDTFETTPSRGWRLEQLGVVIAPRPWEYDYEREWAELRKLIDARPNGMVAFPTKRRSLRQLRPGERLLLLRKYGGLGDILISSLLFADLRAQYPEIQVTYAVPRQYHCLFEGTGLRVIPYEDIYSDSGYYHQAGVQAGILKEYDLIEDISIPCHVWENLFVAYGGVDNANTLHWRNRVDMWSRWFGLKCTDPQTIIRLTETELAEAKRLLGRAKPKRPHLVLAPISASRTKNYPWYARLADRLSAEWTIHYLHSTELPGSHPTLANLPYRMMGAVCAVAPMVVSVDSAAFHWGGILGTPTVGIFNVNDGATYCKYYPNATSAQCCLTPCINTKYRNCDLQYKGADTPVVSGLGLEMSKCYHPGSVDLIAATVARHATAHKVRA